MSAIIYSIQIYYEVSSPPASMYLSLLKQPSSVIDKFVQMGISGLLLNN